MDIESSPRGYLTAFFRQSGAMLLVFLAVLGAGGGYLMKTKPVYEAHGSVVVKFGQDAGPETADGQSIAGDSDAAARQEIIKSYIKIISSQNMLHGIVHDFGVYRLYPELKEELAPDVPAEDVAVNRLLEDDLKVSYDQSYVIDIAVQNNDPEIAAQFAAMVMNAFIRRRTEIYNQPKTDFLQQQIEEARQKLEGAQQKLQDFKEQAGISSIDEELEQLLREKSEMSTLAYSAVTDAQAKLAELESKEADMRATYRDDSPPLVRLRQTIDVAREDLKRRQAELNSTSVAGGSLGGKIANVNKRLAYLESKRGEMDDLKQQVKLNEDNYLFYRKRGEEARINSLMIKENITRIAVVDRPSVPVVPIKPRRSIFLAVTLLAAVMAGMGAALARELLDDRFSNPDQLNSALRVPVLATFEKEFAK